VDSFAHDVSICHQIIISKFCNDVLLLHHLNFLDYNLEVDQREIIQVLKEHPEFGHRCAVNDLHQLRNIHILVTLEAFVWHMALLSKFFEDI
jgi:hypothetical protein